MLVEQMDVPVLRSAFMHVRNMQSQMRLSSIFHERRIVCPK